MMPFTFYSDLLGVSASYNISPEATYERLDKFYNLSFEHLRPFCSEHTDATVNMFSDTLLFWGDHLEEAVPLLATLYRALLQEGLLLRGAIVPGRIEFDPRFTVQNFQKNLPVGDVLPRAVGLSNSVKGARLLLAREIAHHLLPGTQWHTVEGYLANANLFYNILPDDYRRFICPTPDQSAYEVLYYFKGEQHEEASSRLKNIMNMYSDGISVHYKETIGLIERSKKRTRL
jgi:hypothetical protein